MKKILLAATAAAIAAGAPAAAWEGALGLDFELRGSESQASVTAFEATGVLESPGIPGVFFFDDASVGIYTLAVFYLDEVEGSEFEDIGVAENAELPVGLTIGAPPGKSVAALQEKKLLAVIPPADLGQHFEPLPGAV